MDEIIEMLKKTTNKTQKLFDESKELASKRAEIYEGTLRSKELSETEKVQALLRKTVEYDRLEWLSSQLSLLYILQIFGFKVKILQISIENLSKQLSTSGILDRTKDIEDTKKDIEELKILLEAQYEFIRNIGETKKSDLPYVS